MKFTAKVTNGFEGLNFVAKFKQLDARSVAEAYLFMSLHTCVCGSNKINFSHSQNVHDDHIYSTYSGFCINCDAQRRFEFCIPVLSPTEPDMLPFGGSEPSTIIDAGQYMVISSNYAKHAANHKSDLNSQQREQARNLTLRAIGALDEVEKFIPIGEFQVPKSGFFTKQGMHIYKQNPGYFVKSKIESQYNKYFRILNKYQ